jgi:hypothetical protein
MMRIRPPVVREMNRDLWAKMTAKPGLIQAQPTAAPEVTPTDARLGQLRSLGELWASGVLTDEEFEREKARILA